MPLSDRNLNISTDKSCSLTKRDLLYSVELRKPSLGAGQFLLFRLERAEPLQIVSSLMFILAENGGLDGIVVLRVFCDERGIGLLSLSRQLRCKLEWPPFLGDFIDLNNSLEGREKIA